MSRWTADELYQYIETLEFESSSAPSVDGDKHFVYTQSTPSDTWEITHNLNKNPSVSIVDSAGSLVVGDCEYVNENKVILHFGGAFSGKAYFN